MEVQFKPMYSCKLVLDLEKERNHILREASLQINPVGDSNALQDFMDYSMQFYITKYCQMGLNRRWHDYYKELTRNINAIDAGKMDEVTMPELINDVDAWSDEDKMVYAALKSAKQEAAK